MNLSLLNHISLLPGAGQAAYGRPAFHRGTARLYIPMTDEDALGVVDCVRNVYLHALPDLPGAISAAASDQGEIVLAAVPARSEVVAIEPGEDRVVAALNVGGTPHELAYDPSRGHLLVTFSDPPTDGRHYRVAVVDVQQQKIIGDVRVPGATHQVLYDRQSDMFYVVVAKPAQIVVLAAGNPTRVAHAFDVAADGLRSIAVGPQGTRLFCACDDSTVVTIDRRSGHLLSRSATSGSADTVLYDAMRSHLYAAIAERGVIEVFDTVGMTSLGSSQTERGARQVASDQDRHRIYALLPESRRVAVYEDST